MNKKLIGYAGFFAILLIVFLVFVFAGTDNWKEKSPVLSTVKPFHFTTQDGRVFTDNNMMGKVCVVNYFFTTCKGICPRMNGNLHKIYDAFKDEPDFLIVSHTSDPGTDSAATLKKYAQKLNADSRHWVFLTGRKDSLYQAARNSYLLDDPKNAVININDQFLHTQFIALVDKNGQVRGHIYDGLKQADLAELSADIKTLLKEKANRSNFSNNIFGTSPNNFMQTTIPDILKRNKLSITDSRTKILSLFQKANGAIAHADVEKLTGEHFDRVTIYRTLQTFVEKGIIHTIPTADNSVRYALCKDNCEQGHHHDDHVHFICDDCGTTYCLDKVSVPEVQLPKGFAHKQTDVVISGICKNCN